MKLETVTFMKSAIALYRSIDFEIAMSITRFRSACEKSPFSWSLICDYALYGL